MAEVLSRESHYREWQCPRCTAVNSPADIDCLVCTSARPGRRQLGHHLQEEQSQLPEEGPVKHSFVDNVKSLVLGRPLPWQCPKCTCEMGGYYTKCTVCGFLRTDIRRKSDSVISDLFSKFRWSPNSRRASHQATSVDPDRDSGYQEGGWTCPQCTFKNEEKAKCCSMCDYRKHSRQKKDNTRVKEKYSPLDESFEVIGIDGQTFRVVPSSLPLDSDVFDSMLQEESVFTPKVHYPTDPSTVAIPTEQSVLVVPSPFSPKHISLPSPPPPQPHPQPHPSSLTYAQPKPRTAVISSDPNAPSWKCSVCGAFNLIFGHNQKCFVCGIGQMPQPEDVDAANNGNRPYPRSLVVPSNPVPRPEGNGQLVYMRHPNPAALLPQPTGDHHVHSRVETDGQVQLPRQRPNELSTETRHGQGSGDGRRRRDSSIRRSAEDTLGTPTGSTTVLTRVVKHHYEVEADRMYKEICQFCEKVSVKWSKCYVNR